MIARFRVLLPFEISRRYGDVLTPYIFEQNDYRIRVFPPYRISSDPSILENTRAGDIEAGLMPADPQPVVETVRVDSAPTIPANGLQIDFSKETFDRSRPDLADPPFAFAFDVANNILARWRSIGRAAVIRLPLTKSTTTWHLRYLTDEGLDLPVQVGMSRGFGGRKTSFRLAALNAALWTAAEALPQTFRPQPWESLLLDATALLPEIGPSIAAAYSALEVFIVWTLDRLASRSSVPAELWEWINDRGGRFEKEPSVAERFDVVLKSLTGKSLKDEATLWQAFKNLQSARHSFIHEGTPLFGGHPVDEHDAYRWIGQAQEIVGWVEMLLPLDLRRPNTVACHLQFQTAL